MTKFLDVPFRDNSSFPLCRYLGANGTFKSAPTLPTGIAGRIWIEDAVCNMYVNTQTDANTAGWKRTEIDFGEFPTPTGEMWCTFDFQYHWDFSDYIVLGSWSVMIDGQSGVTYVPLGFRMRDHHFIIQASLDYSIGFSNRQIASIPVTRGRWYRVCAHANLQPNSTGFIEVFVDGMPIVRMWNTQSTYSTATAHYFKLGPYDGSHTMAFDEALLRIRNVTMWSGNDGYNAVMGGAPTIPQRRVAF